ncbi:peptidoglycan endopeptidase [Bacillus methanolicus]|nr:peptidoglycan endopeptidase [Bacillus methanolicus]
MRKRLLTVTAAVGFLFTSLNGTASAHEKIHTVKYGESLWEISKKYNVSVSNLQKWNHLSGSKIYPGQKLTLLAPHSHSSGTASKSGTVTYTVKSGESLWTIARKFGMTVSELKKINKLSRDTIHPGQKLLIKSTKTAVDSVSYSNVNALIAEAKKYIGVPYAWGGSTPSGFDCSGYLNYVYKKVGISIPRTVASIWNATKKVSSPRVGDIVFFETNNNGPSHAGIYLGNNKFIHAGSSTGVTISDKNSSYWGPRYIGARTAF